MRVALPRDASVLCKLGESPAHDCDPTRPVAELTGAIRDAPRNAGALLDGDAAVNAEVVLAGQFSAVPAE